MKKFLDCKGVDVFVIYNGVPPLPKKVGPLELELISNRGTSMPLDGSEPGFMLVDWHRARYTAKAEVGDPEINELLVEITKVGQWEKAQKLFYKGDTPLYSKAHG